MILPVERKTRENLVVYDHRYDKEIFKITLPSGRKIKIYGPTYQHACNIATTSSIQNRISAIAQGATSRQLKIIKDGEFFGPPLTEGMSIIRCYTLGMMKGRNLQQDPKTRAKGIELEEAAKRTLELQSELYNLDWKNLKLNP